MVTNSLKRTKKEQKLIFLALGNWFLEILNKWQLYIVTTVLIGVAFQNIVHEEDMYIFIFLAIFAVSFSKLSRGVDGILSAIWCMIKYTFLYSILLSAYYYIPSEQYSNRIMIAWLISATVYLALHFWSPRLFKKYLFKQVLNKEYLCVRKVEDSLSSKDNFFEDMRNGNFGKMQPINQKAIQTDYQNIVRIGLVDSSTKSVVQLVTDLQSHETKQVFVDNVNSTLLFQLYPLGFSTPISTFVHFILLKLNLFENEAFTQLGMSHSFEIK